jgi:hypothetical protein
MEAQGKRYSSYSLWTWTLGVSGQRHAPAVKNYKYGLLSYTMPWSVDYTASEPEHHQHKRYLFCSLFNDAFSVTI